MRRFSLMVLAMTVLLLVLSDGEHPARLQNADQPLSAKPAMPESGQLKAGWETSSGPAASGQAEPGGALVQTAAKSQTLPSPLVESTQTDYIATAPMHVAASAKVGGIDAALESLGGRDLTLAVQGELKRLGCYEAKLDGKWGRKSDAAVEAFSERAGDKWADASRRDLVVALRTYPAGFCTAECAAKTESGQCTVAAAPDVKAALEPGKNDSYLPPWMQGAKPGNTARPETALSVGRSSEPDAAPLTAKPKKAKSVRRRGSNDRNRTAQRVEPRRITSSEWVPEGWPRRR